jgi:hypothetical protein
MLVFYVMGDQAWENHERVRANLMVVLNHTLYCAIVIVDAVPVETILEESCTMTGSF